MHSSCTPCKICVSGTVKSHRLLKKRFRDPSLPHCILGTPLETRIHLVFSCGFQDSKVGIRCSSKGLKVAEMSSFSNQVSLNVTSEVKPFQSLTIQMYVRADLTQLPASKDSHSIEHRVKLSVYVHTLFEKSNFCPKIQF